jgi:hypothetical protein
MDDYYVSIAEVHYRTIKVTAVCEEDAIDLAKVANENAADELMLEYSHTMKSDMWIVEKKKN